VAVADARRAREVQVVLLESPLAQVEVRDLDAGQVVVRTEQLERLLGAQPDGVVARFCQCRTNEL